MALAKHAIDSIQFPWAVFPDMINSSWNAYIQFNKLGSPNDPLWRRLAFFEFMPPDITPNESGEHGMDSNNLVMSKVKSGVHIVIDWQ